MLNNQRLVKIIAIGPLLFIPFVVLIISLIILKTSNNSFNESLKKIEINLIYTERKAVVAAVDSIVSHITYREVAIKKRLIQRVKKRVINAHKIATNIYNQYEKNKSKKEIQEIIINALRPLTWNNGESFIWILDYDGIFFLAPTYLRHLEQTSILEFRDATGKYVIKEEIAICREKQEGFLWDTFTKPNEDTDKQFKQVAFVKAFGHYNWYLGSAEYLDTAQKKADVYLLESLKKMYELSTNYVMISNTKGDILLNRTLPKLIGKNVHDLDNPVLIAIYDKATKLLTQRDNGFVTYSWNNQSTGKKETKYTYISKVPNTEWVVASGYYESTIKNIAAQKSVELYKLHNIKIKKLLLISAVLILISLLISYLISKKIKQSFTSYKKQINQKNIEYQKLNTTLEYRVATRTKELEELTHKLEILATTDSLTKIHNRYSIMKILNVEIHRSQRYKQPLSVMMYDIDFFKNINDTYGHDVGDTILLELTNVVNSSLRDIDFIGRYGGEEFLVIMPATPLKSANEIASRIHKEVMNHCFSNDIKITISLGIVELNEGEDTNHIFKRLDNLLYESKEGGRNKISF